MRPKLFSVAYMFLITLALTSLVSAVKEATDQRIRTNEKIKLQKIILNVLNIPIADKASGEDIVRIFQDRVKTTQIVGDIVYIGYEEDGKTLRGYAFPVGGPGFWGPIFGMVGVNREANKILGIAFYKHSETPGLGARMTEDWFRNQFVDLPIFPIEGDQSIFYLSPAGPGKSSNELDAITGATGTSRGIQAFLNRDLDRFLRKSLPELLKD